MEILYSSASRTPIYVVVPSVDKKIPSGMVEDLSRNGRSQVLGTKEQVSHRFGEVAGGTTAEFAAVVCCPCGLLDLALLAFVKLPADLSKRVWRRAKRKKSNAAVEGKQIPYEDSDTEDPSTASSHHELLRAKHKEIDQSCVSTERFWEEVVGKSYVGFWRNHSLKE